jgi:large subunit ribosomal protein L22
VATAEETRTNVRAQARYVRAAPRKAMLVADQIRGRSVPEARTILAFMTRDAARDIEKVLSSAVANAENNHGLVGDDLFVSAATVGSGPTLKRWRARARGRVARIRKRTCHITIALALPEGATIPAPAGPKPVEEPKPARAPRKQAEPKTEGEEKPKPKARARKPAEKKTSGEKPKPARRTTKKKESDS